MTVPSKIMAAWLLMLLPVCAGAQTITAIAPMSGTPGQTIDVMVRGAGTHFINQISLADFGAEIAVQKFLVHDSLTGLATILISPSAQPGFRKVIVTTLNEIASLERAFEVMTPAGALRATLQVLPVAGVSFSSFDISNLQAQPVLFYVNIYNDAVRRKVQVDLSVNAKSRGSLGKFSATEVALEPNAQVRLSNREFNRFQPNGMVTLQFLNELKATGKFPPDEYTYKLEINNEQGVLVAGDEAVLVVTDVPAAPPPPPLTPPVPDSSAAPQPPTLPNPPADLPLPPAQPLPANNLPLLTDRPYTNPGLIAPGFDFTTPTGVVTLPLPFFQWYGQGQQYDFALYKFLPGQTPEEVVRSLPVFQQTNITGHHFLYPNYAEKLVPGTFYAWQVREKLTGLNETRHLPSEVFRFVFAEKKEAEAAGISRLTIMPQEAEVFAGQEIHFQVAAWDKNGQLISAVQPIWQITPLKGTITPNGLFTAGKENTTTLLAILAKAGGATDFATVTIKPRQGNTNPVKDWLIREMIRKTFGIRQNQ